MASIERSMSEPTSLAPTTVPLTRVTAMPVSSAAWEEPARCVIVGSPGLAAAGNVVVAAAALEFVEEPADIVGDGAAGVVAGRAEAPGVVGIVGIAAGHHFDRLQDIEADAAGIKAGAG